MVKKQKKQEYNHEPIAVIGMACIFPKAPDVKTFWQNILNGVSAIGSPLPQWEAERYLKSGRITTDQGGYLKELFRFNPKEFGIMPSSVDGGEPDQLLALQVAKRALEDAGEKYVDGSYDHTDTGIVLGHSTYYHRGQVNTSQHHIGIDQTMDILQAVLPMDEQQAAGVRDLLKKQLPQFNADICPSQVPNVMTGRIANRLNFTGPNYLIDAACASSLLAVNAAMDELRKGTSRMMLAGGVNASLPAEVAVIFTLLDALSGRGKVRPFEEGSDGTLLGEGLGIVALKRLSDALEDGDKIYAVVHGVGQSSDGRGLGLLAPSERGEVLAIRRAYEASGIDPKTIGLIEAHGTGIVLGDKTEIASLKHVLGSRIGAQGHIAIGSVKSMISHCIPAAGIASFIKMCLSLHHKILPPTLCEKVNPALRLETTPLYINNTVKPWVSKRGVPCRAAINSFGFGGVNAHAILEEAPSAARRPLDSSPRSAELCTFAAETLEALKAQLARLSGFLAARPDVSLSDVAYSLWEQAKTQKGSHRLAIVAADTAELAHKIAQSIARLEKNGDKPLLGKGGVAYSSQPVAGKMAFVFPGEGSQYIGMLSDIATHFAPVREWFDLWHGLYDELPGSTRTDIVFPVNSELTPAKRAALDARLHGMDVGSEAVFVAGQAMFSLLKWLGVEADVMLGHSSGESSALAASGAIRASNLEQMGGFVRALHEVYEQVEAKGGIATGSLMAIALMPRDKIAEHIKDTGLTIAMENCPTQTIVFGDKAVVAALSGELTAAGAICEILPFDRGYHTPAFVPMQRGFAEYYDAIGLGLPKVPLYSCASAGLFPDDVAGVRSLAAAQWAQTVRFIDTVNAMQNNGVGYFIEVGPSGKLTSFIEQILRGKPCVIAASNVDSKPGLPQLLELMAKLYVNDKAGAERLFENRDVTLLDFDVLQQVAPVGVLLNNTMPRFYATPALVNAIAQERAVENKADLFPEHRPFFTHISEASTTRFIGHARLVLAEDNFLQDHVLSGRVSERDPQLLGLSCVPLMVTLEMMAEACAVLADSINVTVIEDVRTFNWVTLDSSEVTLEVQASARDGRYFAEVFNADSKVMSAVFSFDERQNSCGALAPLVDADLGYNWPADYELYQKGMFHGPVFQSIRSIAGWNEQGIDARLSDISLCDFFSNGQTPKLVLNPVLLDALSQLPAFWIAQQIGPDFNCFPSQIERIELYANCPQDVEGVNLSARKATKDAWNFECSDAQGQVLLRVNNLHSVFFPVPNAFYRCRHDPLNGWLGNPVATENAGLQWYLPYLAKDFCAQSGAVFLRMLAHCILSRREREEWLGLTCNNSEKSRWLFARMCIKEAVRYWVYEQAEELLYPSDVEVGFDANDAPLVDGWWCDELAAAPRVWLEEASEGMFAAVEEVAAREPLFGNL